MLQASFDYELESSETYNFLMEAKPLLSNKYLTVFTRNLLTIGFRIKVSRRNFFDRIGYVTDER